MWIIFICILGFMFGFFGYFIYKDMKKSDEEFEKSCEKRKGESDAFFKMLTNHKELMERMDRKLKKKIRSKRWEHNYWR